MGLMRLRNLMTREVRALVVAGRFMNHRFTESIRAMIMPDVSQKAREQIERQDGSATEVHLVNDLYKEATRFSTTISLRTNPIKSRRVVAYFFRAWEAP